MGIFGKLFDRDNNKDKPTPNPNDEVNPRRRPDLRVRIDDVAKQRTEVDTGTSEYENIESPYVVAAAQTIGAREDQEDAYIFSDCSDMKLISGKGLLVAMADGIGGMDNGQIASKAAMDASLATFNTQTMKQNPADRVLEITAAAQNAVLEAGKGSCGSTFMAALIEDMEMSMCSVGDSRIVLYRGGVLMQLNREHVLGREVDEMNILTGANRQEDNRRRKAVTSYLGKSELRALDRNINPIQLIAGDKVLLMSDGVFGVLSDSGIAAYLDMEPQAAANAIIKAVVNKKVPGQDNATIVIVGVK